MKKKQKSKDDSGVTYYGRPLDAYHPSLRRLPGEAKLQSKAEFSKERSPLIRTINEEQKKYQKQDTKALKIGYSMAFLLLVALAAIAFLAGSPSIGMAMTQKEGKFSKFGESISRGALGGSFTIKERNYHLVGDGEFDEAFKTMTDAILEGQDGTIYRYLNIEAKKNRSLEYQVFINVTPEGGESKAFTITPEKEFLTDVSYEIRKRHGEYTINYLKHDGEEQERYRLVADLVDIQRGMTAAKSTSVE